MRKGGIKSYSEEVGAKESEKKDHSFDLRCCYTTRGYRCRMAGSNSFDTRPHASTKFYCRFHFGVIGGSEYSRDAFDKWHGFHIEYQRSRVEQVESRFGSAAKFIADSIRHEDDFNRNANKVWDMLTGGNDPEKLDGVDNDEKKRIIYDLADSLRIE